MQQHFRLFIISTAIASFAMAQNCIVPSPLQDQSVFTMRSSLLQVFTSLTVPCNGSVVAWNFVPRVAQITDLYLAVFRPVKQNMPFFSIVGYTKVGSLTVATINRWNNFPVAAPFEVLKGDVLGIFYDDWQVLESGAAIPVSEPPLGGQTYVFTHDFKSLSKIPPEANGQRIIDLSQATKTIRLAAFQVEVAATTTTPTTTTTTSTTTTTTTTTTTAPTTVTTRPTRLTTFTFPTTTTRTTLPPFDYNEITFEVETTPETTPLPLPDTTTPAYMRCLQRVEAMAMCTIMYYEEKWFFRPETNSCQLIWWFPYCMASENLFQTKDECELICSRYIFGK